MANKGKKKRAPDRAVPDRKQVPAGPGLLPASETSDERITWRFAYADHEEPWKFCGLADSELHAVLSKLADLETMTIDQIRTSGPNLFKDYTLPGKVIKQALDRLAEMGRDDMTTIQRFRLSGERRLYGFLSGNVFHVVWWDPKHEIWPSELRNT